MPKVNLLDSSWKFTKFENFFVCNPCNNMSTDYPVSWRSWV